MDAADGAVVERQCQKAMVAFFRCLDESDYAGLLARMHPEGVWLRQGKQLKGEQQILEAMRARNVSGAGITPAVQSAVAVPQ